MLRIIKSPWEKIFVEYLKEAKQTVYLASPFIKKQTAQLIVDACSHNIDIRYINSFKLASFHRQVSDLEALKIFHENRVKQKSVHNLHAKLFIFDSEAIITSGNLTPGGLKNNLEYGILVQEKIVDEIKRDYLRIFDDPENPAITADVIKKAEDILLSVPKEKRPKIKISDNKLFDEVINDENIVEKYKGGIESIRTNLPPWRRDVFECLLEIKNDVFTLEEVYFYEARLSQLHPRNQHIQDKIRQQLQYLRNVGLVEFIRPGLYKKLWV